MDKVIKINNQILNVNGIVKISDANLVPENIKEDIEILGVTGTYALSSDPVYVYFRDYDGTILYTYTLKQAHQLEALPALPDRTAIGLIAEAWNFSLEEIKALTEECDIGAIYATTSNKLELDIEINSDLHVGFNWYLPNATYDWGDGTADTNTDHTYSLAGKYTIKVGNLTYIPGNQYHAVFGLYENVQSSLLVDDYICKEIRFPNTVTSCSSTGVFNHMVGIKHMSISNSVRSLLISGLTSLDYINIPPLLTSTALAIYDVAFKRFTFPNNITTINFKIGASLNNYYSKCLEMLYLPTSLNNIINLIGYPYYKLDLSKYTGVSITAEILAAKFFGNFVIANLLTITNWTESGSRYAFTYSYIQKVILPDCLTIIGSNMFEGCKILQEVILPTTLTTIKYSVFTNCNHLSKIELPSTLTSLGTSAFYNCESLTKMILPVGITAIPSQCFYNCLLLKTFTALGNITTIGSSAFKNVGRCLDYFDFRNCTAVPTIQSSSFSTSNNYNYKVIIPDSLYDEWIAATNWASLASKIIKVSEYIGD